MTYKTEEERENAKKESKRIYYNKNREKIIAKMKEFNKKYYSTTKNKDKQKQAHLKYYAKNKESICEKQRVRDRANSKYRKKKNDEYRERKKEEKYKKDMEHQTPITLYFN